MLDSAMKLLTMTSEAAVLVRRGRTVYANSAAQILLGGDCLGKRVSELFGEVVSGVQASSFLAQIRIQNRPLLLRLTALDGDQVIFLRPQEELPAVLNQPYLYALRSALMNLELAADRMRAEAEALGEVSLLEGLSTIARSQYQILRLLNNASLILGLSDGSAVNTTCVFDLSALCASALDAMEAMFPHIRFQNRCGSGMMLSADPRLIKDLLMNLLSNAIRHGHGCSHISVSLLETERSVVLAVDDDGCGIPAEDLPLVFDRYRHSFDLSQMSAGPGLGLTAARLIAQLHGGALLLESRAGAGTTLRVSLKREKPERLHVPSASAPAICETKDLLTGLADCLPAKCFREQYLD